MDYITGDEFIVGLLSEFFTSSTCRQVTKLNDENVLKVHKMVLLQQQLGRVKHETSLKYKLPPRVSYFGHPMRIFVNVQFIFEPERCNI